jgi:BlaI family transcriptional regulator, penicillinase repressor
MSVLWARPSDVLTGRAVADELPTYAYTTVATILNRLARKGMVRREKSGPTIVYTAVVTDAARTATAMRQLLAETADPATALVHFAELASPAEARALRRALDAPLSTQAGTRRAQDGHRAGTNAPSRFDTARHRPA